MADFHPDFRRRERDLVRDDRLADFADKVTMLPSEHVLGADSTSCQAVKPYRKSWVWPVCLPAAFAVRLYATTSKVADRMGPLPYWLIAGAAIGAIPWLVEYFTAWSISRFASALLATPLLIAAVARDSAGKAFATVGAAVLAHSALTILLAARHPEQLPTWMPDGQAYWEQSRDWIVTGALPRL